MFVALWVLCAQAQSVPVLMPAGHMESGEASMGGALLAGLGSEKGTTGSLAGWGRYASADRLEWFGGSRLMIPYNGLRVDGGVRWLVTNPSPWVNIAVSLDPSIGVSWQESSSAASLLLPVRVGGRAGPAEWWVYPWAEVDLYDVSTLPGLGLQLGAGAKQAHALRGELGYGYVDGGYTLQFALGVGVTGR